MSDVNTATLPEHAPCGTSYGQIDWSTMAVTCEERRTFERCGCKRRPGQEHRGAANCGRCHGSGSVIVSREPGCGDVYRLCRHCGNRTIVERIDRAGHKVTEYSCPCHAGKKEAG